MCTTTTLELPTPSDVVAMIAAVEQWYTGKALADLRSIVQPYLVEAATIGYWPKGASRTVVACLSRQAVAKKFVCANTRNRNDSRHLENDTTLEGLLDDVSNNRKHYYSATQHGYHIVAAMRYGTFRLAPALTLLVEQLVTCCRNVAERNALATGREWVEGFTPIANMIEALDATRPVPTIVMGSLSPTVARNVGLAMGVQFETIRCPEIIYTYTTVEIDGKLIRMPCAKIVWPANTIHNSSRFSGGEQCHACGHRIRNATNWCPLVADTATGPASLWVGSDCAKKLFAVEVKNGVELPR